MPALYRRGVVFGFDKGQEFAFDPHDTVDQGAGEYRIYSLSRVGEPTPIAESFAAFLSWAAYFYTTCSRPDAATPAVQIDYEPPPVRRRQPPSPNEIQSWLAFNNNTIRDLVRSIRDEGCTEAFPVLADALEEAGCANADLLDSCRTGDPDIDGAWVLRVLLGDG
jgi:hypothetical protein